MSDQKQDQEKKPKRPGRGKYERQPPEYGPSLTGVVDAIEGNPDNVFGQYLYHAAGEKRLNIKAIMDATGLNRDKYYRLLMLREFALSTDPEFIFRIAQVFGIEEQRLLAMYFQSHKRYFSPEFRGIYRMQEYDREALSKLVASFVFLWELIVHSQEFQKASQEEQGELSLELTQLIDLYTRMPKEDRKRLLSTAAAWAPATPQGKVDPKQRTEEQLKLGTVQRPEPKSRKKK